MGAVGSSLKTTYSHPSICILFPLETAQKNEDEGDAEYDGKEFSKAAVFYTKGIEVNCKDVALNAVLYKKRAASHFLMGEFRPLFDFQFSNNRWRRGGLIVSALLIERSGLEHWPGTLRCVLGQDTSLMVSLSSLSTQMYKWVLATLMLRVTLLWTVVPSRGE